MTSRDSLTGRALLLAALFALAGALPAAADQGIDEVRVHVLHESVAGQGVQWRFEVEARGRELGQTFFLPPGGVLTAMPGSASFKTYDEVFATLDALEAKYPAGGYQFLIGDDLLNVVVLSPTLPNSDVDVIFPLDGSAVPNQYPAFVIEHDCTNCSSFEAVLVDNGQEILQTASIGGADIQCGMEFDDFDLGRDATGPVNHIDVGKQLDFAVRLEVRQGAIVSSEDGDTLAFFQSAFETDLIDFTVVASPVPGPQVDEVILEYRLQSVNRETGQWLFRSTVEGRRIGQVDLYPPCVQLFNRALDEEDDGFFFFGAGPFADADQMRATYPPSSIAGRYIFVVDGGADILAVDFAPELPDEPTVVASPLSDVPFARGEDPTFEIGPGGCSNCDFMLLALTDVATDGDEVRYEFATDGPSFPETIEMSDLGGNLGSLNGLATLPDGRYLVTLEVGLETTLVRNGTMVVAAAVAEDLVDSIRVPEPGFGLLQLVALATAVAAARRRRASETSSAP